jgi:hypothetical protein
LESDLEAKRECVNAAGMYCEIHRNDDMRPILKNLPWLVGALIVLSTALILWVNDLAKDDGDAGRPTYGAYTWPAPESSTSGAMARNAEDDPRARLLPQTPRGGPVPRADGYVMGSLGNDFILPPMPPERSTDIARKDNAFKNSAIKSCFWPGPKLRTGYYPTDPDKVYA